MKKVQLSCKTLGFPFGEILEVGEEYKAGKETKKVTEKQLEELVKNGHAVALGDKVASGAKEVKKLLDEANKEIARLKADSAGADTTIVDAINAIDTEANKDVIVDAIVKLKELVKAD